MKNNMFSMIIWVFLFAMSMYFLQSSLARTEISYADFKQYLASGAVVKVDISENYITGSYRSSNGDVNGFKAGRIADPQLGAELDLHAVPHTTATPAKRILRKLATWGPILILIYFWTKRKIGKNKASKRVTDDKENPANKMDKIF